MAKNIAIVGGAPSFEGAPFDDPDWDIWAASVAFNRLPGDKVDRWFEVHEEQVIKKIHEGNGFFDWLYAADARSPVTIFPDSGFDELPNSEVYPRQRIETKWGSDWWTSTVAWMLALALEDHDGKIGLFGVEMCADEEYGQQQAALRHFRDIALLTGREILFPKGCNLLNKQPVYPDDVQTSGYQHCIREMKRLKRDKATIDSQIEELKAKSNHADGAIAVYDHLTRNNWV